MNKRALRQSMKTKLHLIDKISYEDYSYKIAKKVVKSNEWIQAKTVGITISQFPEVDTWQLIRNGWEQGKKIVIPKCYPQEKKMLFRKLSEFKQLEIGYNELYEPKENETELVIENEIDLLIVPGLAFSRKGYRVGFGGGYYDRFLTNFCGNTLSLSFSIQLVPDVPIEEHDIPVQKLITEEEIIFVSKKIVEEE